MSGFAYFAVALALAGCATTVVNPPPPVYTPPAPRAPLDLTVVSDRGFDATWDALINYASATRFSIDEFERASGLLTLSYAPADPREIVDCGTWREGEVTRPYVERTKGMALTTRANVFVQQGGGGQTRLRASINYELRDGSGHVYAFTTNEPETVRLENRAAGTPLTRTCASNHVAEKEFLDGVRNALR